MITSDRYKNSARAFANKLAPRDNAKGWTLVHGDAKGPNFLFNDSQPV